MRTHIFTALLALVLTACASHHRDVASVQDNDHELQTQHAGVDAVNARGGSDVR